MGYQFSTIQKVVKLHQDTQELTRSTFFQKSNFGNKLHIQILQHKK